MEYLGSVSFVAKNIRNPRDGRSCGLRMFSVGIHLKDYESIVNYDMAALHLLTLPFVACEVDTVHQAIVSM